MVGGQRSVGGREGGREGGGGGGGGGGREGGERRESAGKEEMEGGEKRLGMDGGNSRGQRAMDGVQRPPTRGRYPPLGLSQGEGCRRPQACRRARQRID